MKNKMILRILAVFSLILAVPFTGSSETVSQKQASQIAELFFNAAYGQYMSAPKMVWNGRQLTTDRLFAPFYIYNHPAGGFVIISADSKAYPILGYSKTSKFDRGSLSEEENDLLTQYAHEVELIRYDSRVPEKAMSAWQNIPLFIGRMLNNPYDTPEYDALTDEARERLEGIDRRTSSIMMPSAVEFETYNPENYRSYTLDDVTEEEEYIPFSLVEDFMKEVKAEQDARFAALDEMLSPSRPVVSYVGGGHYSVRYPSEILMARIYSLHGMKEAERYYHDTDTAVLDLSALPAGYYVLFAIAADGQVYGVKLAR